MSHQTHHKKKEDVSEEQFTEAMNKELEKVPDSETNAKQRTSSTGDEVELNAVDYWKMKLTS